MTFGQVFKNARKNAGKTLREAAELAGMTIGNISDIEHSRRRPPKKEILQEFETFYEVKKSSLVKAAEKEWKIPDEAVSIYSKRPELTMSLLRFAENRPEEELRRILKKYGG
jgi:transcriptional regulator with XRE-family HTH domain